VLPTQKRATCRVTLCGELSKSVIQPTLRGVRAHARSQSVPRSWASEC